MRRESGVGSREWENTLHRLSGTQHPTPDTRKTMNQTKLAITALALSLTMLSCTSYNAFQKAKSAEQSKDWDQAVAEYQKAIDVDPNNSLYQIDLSRAKLEASRVHFQK